MTIKDGNLASASDVNNEISNVAVAGLFNAISADIKGDFGGAGELVVADYNLLGVGWSKSVADKFDATNSTAQDQGLDTTADVLYFASIYDYFTGSGTPSLALWNTTANNTAGCESSVTVTGTTMVLSLTGMGSGSSGGDNSAISNGTDDLDYKALVKDTAVFFKESNGGSQTPGDSLTATRKIEITDGSTDVTLKTITGTTSSTDYFKIYFDYSGDQAYVFVNGTELGSSPFDLSSLTNWYLKFDNVATASSCFLPKQLINMADGTKLPIGEILVGDSVECYDGSNNFKTAVVNEIEIVKHDNVYELELEDGKVLFPTSNHPFKIKDKGWATISGKADVSIPVKKFKVGDEVYTTENTWIKVKKLTPIEGEFDTYNLIDMKYGTFIADDIVVHNSGGSSTSSIVVYNVNHILANSAATNYISSAITTTGTILGATLFIPNSQLPTANGGSFTYALSADNGSNYETVTLGTYHRFSSTGTQIKVKVIGTESATVDATTEQDPGTFPGIFAVRCAFK